MSSPSGSTAADLPTAGSSSTAWHSKPSSSIRYPTNPSSSASSPQQRPTRQTTTRRGYLSEVNIHLPEIVCLPTAGSERRLVPPCLFIKQDSGVAHGEIRFEVFAL